MTTAVKKRLADLRPNAAIHCLHCDQRKPAEGAVKFHAYHVCADCAKKLEGRKT